MPLHTCMKSSYAQNMFERESSIVQDPRDVLLSLLSWQAVLLLVDAMVNSPAAGAPGWGSALQQKACHATVLQTSAQPLHPNLPAPPGGPSRLLVQRAPPRGGDTHVCQLG